MATMLSEVYDALKEAGATESKARAAAEAIAGYDNRFNRIESTLRLHSWMLTFNVALTVGILWIVLQILLSLP